MAASENPKIRKLVPALRDWFATHARDLPWRRTRDPYAIWVSEIMLQQTQVKTVLPFWNRWMRELPTIEAVARAKPAKLHKLWEGLGYYTRVRNLQKAAQAIVAGSKIQNSRGNKAQTKGKSEPPHVGSRKFPEKFDDVLALPGIGRYTAGAICSIAFNQPMPILDGNVIRVLTRVFSIAENPKEKETTARLWNLAEQLIICADELQPARGSRRKATHASKSKIENRKSKANQGLLTPAATITGSCSALNQSLMELGALVCMPRNPQCLVCPVQKLCVAFKEGRTEDLPNLGKREPTTARRFIAFAIERDGKFVVRQRPAGVVNAHLWEFPNVEVGARLGEPQPASLQSKPLRVTHPRSAAAAQILGFAPKEFTPLGIVKHSITRYRITLETFMTSQKSSARKIDGVWRTPAQMQRLAFASAHRKVLQALIARAGE